MRNLGTNSTPMGLCGRWENGTFVWGYLKMDPWDHKSLRIGFSWDAEPGLGVLEHSQVAFPWKMGILGVPTVLGWAGDMETSHGGRGRATPASCPCVLVSLCLAVHMSPCPHVLVAPYLPVPVSLCPHDPVSHCPRVLLSLCPMSPCPLSQCPHVPLSWCCHVPLGVPCPCVPLSPMSPYPHVSLYPCPCVPMSPCPPGCPMSPCPCVPLSQCPRVPAGIPVGGGDVG